MSAKPKILKTSLVRTGAATNRRVELSVLDMFEYPIPIDVAYIFKRGVPVAELEQSLSETLRHYPELAGRLRADDDGDGRLYVDCNDAGAGLTAARSDVSLADLTEAELACFSLKRYFAKNRWLGLKNHDRPLLMIQHTTTSCGGMVLAIQAAHALIDGESLVGLMRAWANVHGGQALTPATLARDGYDAWFGATEATPTMAITVPGLKRMSRPRLYWKVLKLAWDSRFTRSVVLSFSAAELDHLRATAQTDTDNASVAAPLLAHVWRVFADLRPNADADSCGLFVVVGTRHLREQNVPRDYWGNAVWHVRAESSYRELRSAALGTLTDRLREVHAGVGYDAVSEGMQWLRNEHVSGNLMLGVVPDYELMRRDFFATNMFRLPMYEPDFGTGTAAWVTTKPPPIRWMIRLFPRPSGDGIAVHCTVPRSWVRRLASAEMQQRLHGQLTS